MAPQIVDKDAKKFQIIHAALQVFSQNGIAKSKMIDIAQKAGIGKGTIYEYFRSKEEIFSEAFKAMFGGMMEMIEQSIAQIEDPNEKLEKIVNLSLDYFNHEAKDFSGVMMDFWAEGIRTKNEAMMQIINIKQIYNDYRIIISTIVDEGIQQGHFKPVNTDAFAAIAIAALDGIYLQMIMDPGIINIDDVKKTFSDTLFKGLHK